MESISPWMDEPDAAEPPLEGAHSVDVAVVGAGFTGLHAALALREAGAEVAVLEREVAGYGASGRNAGHLTPTIGKDLPSLLRWFGRERAAALCRFAEASVRHVERTLERLAIECDYTPSGNVLAAVHPRQRPRLERAAEAAAALGAAVQYLPPEQMRKRGLPRAFDSGVLEAAGGTLHPGRYLRGLRRAALAAGVRLHEQTPVTRIEPGRVRTPRGEVRAASVILASNAYSGELGLLRSRMARVEVSLFETAPLAPEARGALDWRDREGIYTAHEALESYHLTARGTIVGGSKYVHYGFGGRPSPRACAAIQARIERIFRERFPELEGVPIARFWSGPIACTLDFLPSVGGVPGRDGVYHAAGYCGHGVAVASRCGALVADLALGREVPELDVFSGFRLRLPPEPLRWLLIRSITAALDAVDARTDRAVRSRASQRAT